MSAPVINCPECNGLGQIDGFECGVCFGDQVLLRPDDSILSDAVDRITADGSRFVDHSGVQHDCSRCSPPPPTGAERIGMERARQVDVEGYTPEHDADHDNLELIEAAHRYLVNAGWTVQGYVAVDEELPPWPWSDETWKPSDDPIRDLEKAGALIAAEIDRLDDRRAS